MDKEAMDSNRSKSITILLAKNELTSQSEPE